MTLGIAAKFKDGIMVASDLAISAGSAKREMTEGKWFDMDDAVVLYAGTLYYVQEVQFEDGPLRTRLQTVYEAHKEDDEKDDCEMLWVGDGRIVYFEHYGSFYDCGDYGCVGNGADLADGLLEMVYAPGRSEAWLRGHLDNIFRIVSRKVDGVSRDWKGRVV